METRIEVGSSRRLNWSLYTNFRSRKSVKSLSKICSSLSHEELRDVFRTPDDGGLYPIHWAAINNRSDMITYMIDNGSPLMLRSLNKFLANGTPLHLAAMNGCIEAAAVLLKLYRQRKETDRSSVDTEISGQEKVANDSNKSNKWLNQRDSERQTPLLRCAVPRSKRMDTVRDLLSKNLWSLNARPSETALYLISQGADWRQKDDLQGLNLFHLSIVNDYQDIVDLLLTINQQLAVVPTSPPKPSLKSSTVERTNKSLPSSPEPSENESLIKKEEISANLIEAGIKPLQLAILYCRLAIVKRLWYLDPENESEIGNTDKNLARVLSRMFWINTSELYRYTRFAFLRLFLLFNLIFLVIVWMPTYLKIPPSISGVSSALYLVASLITSALAFRVSFKDPGYLSRNCLKYYTELRKIVEKSRSSEQVDNPETSDSITPEEQVRLLCHKCRCIRVARSRHCNHCNRCVEDFDHHCIYLSSCIGRQNRLEFLIFLVTLSLTAFFGLLIMVTGLSSAQLHQPAHIACLLYIMFLCLYGSFSAFLMLRRACQGVTMFEEIRSNRIRDIFGPQGTPQDINKSHKIFSTAQDSFWRYTPNRFLNGDLKFSVIIKNLKEFTNYSSTEEWFLSIVLSDNSGLRTSSDEQGNSLDIV